MCAPWDEAPDAANEQEIQEAPAAEDRGFPVPQGVIDAESSFGPGLEFGTYAMPFEGRRDIPLANRGGVLVR
jgi:hypothetical protein